MALTAAPAGADPLPRDEVPDPLRPWIDWVLRDEPGVGCPWVVDRTVGERACMWPSRIGFVLEDQAGAFRQEVRAFGRVWVPLPGDARLWPEEVQLDGKPASVLLRGGYPWVRVEPGSHRLIGRLRWPFLPESLRIPPTTGLVNLQLRAERVTSPARPAADRLWLGTTRSEEPETNAVNVVVHRRLSDGVPIQLETRLELGVSGRSRELVFERMLPAGFTPMSLDSSTSLPARLDGDGTLRVQVQPGTLQLTVRARADSRALETAFPEVEGPWDSAEIWVFEAEPALRRVEIQGARAIDPQQTELPPDLRALPAYVVEPGVELRLAEERRTGSEPTPDRLELERTLWLDFDGGGYAIQDRIQGSLARSWRLEMAEPVRLGRVAIDGRDQPINRLRPDGPDGIELRGGQLDLVADARLERRGSIPAVGWDGDFDGARAALRLPPGWTALHVTGPDRVMGGWIDGWTLLELFGVLIGALAVTQLWCRAYGVLALVTLVLVFPEPGAPRYVWLVPLAAQALARVVPSGRAPTVLRATRLVAALSLAWIAVPFAVQQARQGLSPALETARADLVRGRFAGIETSVQEEVRRQAPLSPAPAPEPPGRAAQRRTTRSRVGTEIAEDDAAAKRESALMAPETGDSLGESQSKPDARQSTLGYATFPSQGRGPSDLLGPDPEALVSTGPGIPNWSWRSLDLVWSGPVTDGETFRPLLVPPLVNRLLAWIRVALVGALAVLVLVGPGPFEPLRRRIRMAGASGGTTAAAALVLGLVLGLSPTTARAQFPSEAQLTELRNRLTAPPDCLPACATISRMRLEVEPDQLRARLEVDAAWATGVPLPGSLDGFTPQQVTVDAESSPPLARQRARGQASLLVQVEPGRHQIVLAGPLPDAESLDLPLPLAPKQIEIEARGWNVSGLRADGRATSSLRLVRQRAEGASPDSDAGTSTSSSVSELPPFVRVERRLLLGLSWRVETRVVRVTPPGRPVTLQVPLLPGESVTSTAVDVEGGSAQVTLPPQARSIEWSSVLAPRETIELRAPTDTSWVERWRLDASAIWHVDLDGIPPIGTQRTPFREWWPWPGEAVRITPLRPGPAPGQSVTIDYSTLELSPGARSTNATLTLAVRAGRAERHTLTLPEGAELQGVKIDGRPEPLRPMDGKLELPLRPGAQAIRVEWRSPGGRGLVYGTPAVDLGGSSVNAHTQLSLPGDRWVLWTAGPLLGPSVLFWGVLAVATLLAFGLGRLPLTPLGAGSWLLLFVGLTQVHIVAGTLVVLWLLALGLRGRVPPSGRWSFDATQIGLVLLTLSALGVLLTAIQAGLLGSPDMQIAGNGSSSRELLWYQDRTSGAPERSYVLWVPLWVYRTAMLAWALWLAHALLTWLRWGWSCFSEQGVWRPLRARSRDAPSQTA